jgi:uncharacterized protein
MIFERAVAGAPSLSAIGACTAGGAICYALGTPLPWMIGSLGMMATLKVAGLPLAPPRGGREVGQIVIATALGLYFTPVVMHEVLERWPLLLISAAFAIALGYACAYVISHLSNTDRTTALFASVPGGAAEMAIMGERFGARAERVALAQSLRILLVVIIVPFAMVTAGVKGSDTYHGAPVPIDAVGLALLLGCTAAGACLLRLMKIPNAFLLGPLGVAIALTSAEAYWSNVPSAFTAGGQVLLGCHLGSRFDRASIRSAPRYVVAVGVTIIGALALSAAFAVGLARLSDVAAPTMVLATAPGGIAEMCITANALQLGVPLVTAAHITRVIILVTTTAPLFRLVRLMIRRTGRSK